MVGALARLDCGALRSAPRGSALTGQLTASGDNGGAGNLRAAKRLAAVMSPTERTTAVRTSTIDVGGQRLRVAVQAGRAGGTSLLLLNGIGANLELFQPFVDALDGIGTIRVDLPGAGASPASSRLLRFPGLAR